jgi:beta-lactamase superfamily II metal-dependent hydrolase
METIATQTQWAVGQGFFSSGTVSSGKTRIRYVYDCGALEKYRDSLDREIRDFVDENGPHLDMLFISHLHEDHVSGVESLLNQVQVDRIIIPLVSPSERLMALAKCLSTEELGSNEEWYVNLVVDPRSVLEGDGRQVIEVPPGQDLSDEGGYPQESRDTVAPDSAKEDLDDARLSWPAWGNRAALSSRASKSSNSACWNWRWYVPAQILTRVNDFQQALVTELGITLEELQQALDAKGLRRLVSQHRDELADAYRVAVHGFRGVADGDLNFTSLCLYSGPPSNISDMSCTLRGQARGANWAEMHRRLRWSGQFWPDCRKHFHHCPEVDCCGQQAGWLGTGDLGLKRRIDREEFAKAFGLYAPLVGIFALPHHGSQYSFHPQLLSIFNVSKVFCVVGADPLHHYEHPHREVVSAVAGQGSHLVVVTDAVASRWRTWAVVTSW